MTTRLFWLILISATGSVLALLWRSEIPLGVPGEWTWRRIDVTAENWSEVWLGWVIAAVGAVPLLLVARLGVTRIGPTTRLGTCGWLLGLLAGGFCWLWLLQESPPSGHRLSKSAFVLYYPSASGYFHEIRNQDDLPEFLANYEQTMAQGDVLHIGTHPPGLFILYDFTYRLCHSSPRFSATILSTAPESVQEAFEIIAERSQGTDAALTETDAATLWLVTLLTQLFCVSTIIPLFLLIRETHDRLTSWKTVALWPLLPAIGVFLPKSDALYPAIAAWFVYLWSTGLSRRSLWRAALAGVVLWCGLLMSLALLPAALVGGLYCVLDPFQTLRNRETDRFDLPGVLKLIGCAAAGFALTTLVFGISYRVNLLSVWGLNLTNHAAFYGQYPRTYWKWLLVNPIEFSLSLGAPVAVVLLAALYRTAADSKHERTLPPTRWIACAVVMTLLWLSGKNMGEAARLWIVLMPGILWLCADFFADDGLTDARDETGTSHHHGVWLAVLLCQALCCTATVTRVFGFFQETGPSS